MKDQLLILAFSLLDLNDFNETMPSMPGALPNVKNDQVETVKTKSNFICNTNESGHSSMDIELHASDVRNHWSMFLGKIDKSTIGSNEGIKLSDFTLAVKDALMEKHFSRCVE